MTTTCTMVFIYEGKEYPYEYDFEREYPIEAAHYMFEDGNYSCDCNRSSFINSRYRTNINPLSECGETIQMKNFQVHNGTQEEI